jgi:hypothetical protein
MVLNTLEALVLRGVSVLRDGVAVGLRLASKEARGQTQAVPFSMRHPSHGCPSPTTATTWRPNPAGDASGYAAPGQAGRPAGSPDGVLVRRSPAIIAGGTGCFGRSQAEGAQQFTAAARSGLARAKRAASVGDAFPRPLALRDRIRLSADPVRASMGPAAASTRG